MRRWRTMNRRARRQRERDLRFQKIIASQMVNLRQRRAKFYAQMKRAIQSGDITIPRIETGEFGPSILRKAYPTWRLRKDIEAKIGSRAPYIGEVERPARHFMFGSRSIVRLSDGSWLGNPSPEVSFNPIEAADYSQSFIARPDAEKMSLIEWERFVRHLDMEVFTSRNPDGSYNHEFLDRNPERPVIK